MALELIQDLVRRVSADINRALDQVLSEGLNTGAVRACPHCHQIPVELSTPTIHSEGWSLYEDSTTIRVAQPFRVGPAVTERHQRDCQPEPPTESAEPPA